MHVRWSLRSEPTTTDDLLLDLASKITGLDRAALSTGHVCGNCGGRNHGRPVIRSPAGLLPGLWASVSRAGPLCLVVISESGPVGIDVERDDAVDFPDFECVALHPSEFARTPLEHTPLQRTITWVRKESLLKASGHGLRVDLRDVIVGPPDLPPTLLSWQSRLALGCETSAAEMESVRLPNGYVGCATRLPAGPSRAGEQATPPPRATTRTGHPMMPWTTARPIR